MIVIRFDLKLSRFVALSFFVSVMFYKETELILAYLAAILHECAHGAAALWLGIVPTGAEVNVFGVRLLVPYVTSSDYKFIIYSAGPGASFLIFGYLYFFGRILHAAAPAYWFFVYANFIIGIFNLIPVFPLDGAMLLRTFLSKYLGIIRGTRVYRAAAVFFYGFVAGINFLFIINGSPNFSLIVVMVFLIIGISKEKNYSIMEKKAVLSGEIYSQKKIKYIACDAASELLCLAGYISPDYSLLVASFMDGRFFGELNQLEITEGIKKHGALCQVKDCIENNRIAHD